MNSETDKTPTELTENSGEKKPRAYLRIKDMIGTRKILRIVNVIFAFCLAAACYAWSIYCVSVKGFNDPNVMYLASFGVGTCAILPLLLERVFKFNLSNFVWLLFLTFLTLAGFIGSGLGMYPKWSWFHYDKITHGIFGYIGSVVGLFILCKMSDYKKVSTVLAVIVCFSVSMACGAMWEIFEFCSDRFLGATAQGLPVQGGYALVKDTMLDIVTNFFGAIVFMTHFIAHRVSRKNLVMGAMINDFINN